MDQQRRERIMFFAEHAGYCTPPGRMACAKALADAEELAEQLELEVTWEYEPGSWEDFLGDDPRDRKLLESGKVEYFCAYVTDEQCCGLASLGGIGLLTSTGFSDPYVRVIEAELKAETIEALKKG